MASAETPTSCYALLGVTGWGIILCHCEEPQATWQSHFHPVILSVAKNLVGDYMPVMSFRGATQLRRGNLCCLRLFPLYHSDRAYRAQMFRYAQHDNTDGFVYHNQILHFVQNDTQQEKLPRSGYALPRSDRVGHCTLSLRAECSEAWQSRLETICPLVLSFRTNMRNLCETISAVLRC